MKIRCIFKIVRKFEQKTNNLKSYCDSTNVEYDRYQIDKKLGGIVIVTFNMHLDKIDEHILVYHKERENLMRY